MGKPLSINSAIALVVATVIAYLALFVSAAMGHGGFMIIAWAVIGLGGFIGVPVMLVSIAVGGARAAALAQPTRAHLRGCLAAALLLIILVRAIDLTRPLALAGLHVYIRSLGVEELRRGCLALIDEVRSESEGPEEASAMIMGHTRSSRRGSTGVPLPPPLDGVRMDGGYTEARPGPAAHVALYWGSRDLAWQVTIGGREFVGDGTKWDEGVYAR